MPCSLKPTGIVRDFNATVGQEITINVNGPNPAEIVGIRYAGTELDTTPPFQFRVKPGLQMLVVLLEGAKPGVQVEVVEQCSATETNTIERYRFDPSAPATGYTIHGMSA